MLSQFLCEGGLGPAGEVRPWGWQLLPGSLPKVAVRGGPASPRPPQPSTQTGLGPRLRGAGHLLSELPGRPRSTRGGRPGRLRSSSAGSGFALLLLAPPEEPSASRPRPCLPGCSGRRLRTGQAGGAGDSCHPPPLPWGWAAGHEISSRRWGRGDNPIHLSPPQSGGLKQPAR